MLSIYPVLDKYKDNSLETKASNRLGEINEKSFDIRSAEEVVSARTGELKGLQNVQ